MVHNCELCGNELGPHDRACRLCGTKVGDSIAAPDTAASDPRLAQNLSGPSVTPPPGPFLVAPLPLNSRPPIRHLWLGKVLGGCLAGVTALGLVGWGLYSLWMMGPGGEIAFRYHNSAANTAFERGDFSTADTEYSEMIALRPRRVDGYQLRAINAYKTGQFQRAIRDNTSALALSDSPTSRGVLFHNRADAYYNRRAWAKAVADYTAAEQAYTQVNDSQTGYLADLARMPRWLADVRRGRARTYLQMNEYALTNADYTTNIKNNQILPEDYGMRATAEAALGQDDAAVKDYAQSICIDAGYGYGFQMLNKVVDANHHYDQAVTAYQRATQANPDSVQSWGSLGWYAYEAGKLPTAIAADERALSLDPSQGWISYNLGLACAVAGDQKRATAAYAAALACRTQADPAASLKELRQAAAAHPGSTTLQRALKQVEQAIQNTPRSPMSARTSSATLPAPNVAPAFETLLASNRTLNGYAMRSPAGYTLKQSHFETLSGSEKIDLWKGPARADGTSPDLQIRIVEDDGRMAAASNATQNVQSFLDTAAENHKEFKASPITSCIFNGQAFKQASWSGIGSRTGKPFAGVIYISMKTGDYIEISAHDAVPYSAATLPLLKASVLTFRK